MYCNCFKTFFFLFCVNKVWEKHELSTLSKDNKDQQMIKMVTKKNSVLEKKQNTNIVIKCFDFDVYPGSPFWIEVMDEIEFVMDEFSRQQFFAIYQSAGFTFNGPSGLSDKFTVSIEGTSICFLLQPTHLQCKHDPFLRSWRDEL